VNAYTCRYSSLYTIILVDLHGLILASELFRRDGSKATLCCQKREDYLTCTVVTVHVNSVQLLLYMYSCYCTCTVVTVHVQLLLYTVDLVFMFVDQCP